MMVPIIFLAVGIGFYTGIQKDLETGTQAATDYSKGVTHFFIDGYRITFLPKNHPDIQGKHGFTYKSTDKDIYIQKGLSMDRTVAVCNHELTHNLGISEEHHDFIYRNDERIKSDVCSKLREKLEKIDGITG